AILAGVILMSAAAEADGSAVSVVRVPVDRFDLEASGMMLPDLLAALSADSGVAFTVRGDPSRVRVSDSFEGLDLRLGLQRALARHSHVLIDHGPVGARRHLELILLGAGSARSSPAIVPVRLTEETATAFELTDDGLVAKAFSTAPVAERAAAVEAIAYRSDGEGQGDYADQILVQMLSDPDEALRARAIETLKDTADRLPFAALEQVAREDASAALRIQALELLVERSENDEWREPLRIALLDADAGVRRHARELVLDWHLELKE
ncbi:MAG: hypothetical protein ACRETY_06615, partial [Steroidobacteraceae bacterium]